MLNDRSMNNDDENENEEETNSITDNISVDKMLGNTEISYASKYSNLFVFSGGNKAGMQMMDKEKQAQVIYEMSKDSAYFKRTVKLDAEATAKAQKLLKSFQSLEQNTFLYQRLEQTANQKYLELEKRRVLDRICCVLDMDMFFAAVEIRDRPELKDLPVAVGGIGMISTSNYVARQYGVRAAMPGFIAKKLCPHLVFVNCNFAKYEVVSKQMKEIIAEYDPHYRSWSLDEVYFDLTDAAIRKYAESQRSSSNIASSGLQNAENEQQEVDETNVPSIFSLRAIASEMLQTIRLRICEVTNGLTCSAGMANNFMLAKICADINKPNGQYELPPTRETILQFIQSLSTRKIPGIGKVTEKILSELGIHTLGDVKDAAVKILHAFTATTTDFLFRASLGIASDEGLDPNTIAAHQSEANHRKSMGCERTYSAKGISQRQELYQKLDELCIHLSKDIKAEESLLGGKTVTLKIKDIDFNLHTKAITIPIHSSRELIHTKEQLFSYGKELLDSFLPMKVRLLGINISKLQFRSSSSSSHQHGMIALDRFFKTSTPHNSTSNIPSTTTINVGDTSHGSDNVEESLVMINEDSKFGESVISLLSDQEEEVEQTESADNSDQESLNIANREQYICPICGSEFRCSLDVYNVHIDDCLTLTSLQNERNGSFSNSSGGNSLKRSAMDYPGIETVSSSQRINEKMKVHTTKSLVTGQAKLEHFLKR